MCWRDSHEYTCGCQFPPDERTPCGRRCKKTERRMAYHRRPCDRHIEKQLRKLESRELLERDRRLHRSCRELEWYHNNPVTSNRSLESSIEDIDPDELFMDDGHSEHDSHFTTDPHPPAPPPIRLSRSSERWNHEHDQSIPNAQSPRHHLPPEGRSVRQRGTPPLPRVKRLTWQTFKPCGINAGLSEAVLANLWRGTHYPLRVTESDVRTWQELCRRLNVDDPDYFDEELQMPWWRIVLQGQLDQHEGQRRSA